MWHDLDKFMNWHNLAWACAWWVPPAIVVWLLRKRLKHALLTVVIFAGLTCGAAILAYWDWAGLGFIPGLREALRAWFFAWVGAWAIVIWMLRRTAR